MTRSGIPPGIGPAPIVAGSAGAASHLRHVIVGEAALIASARLCFGRRNSPFTVPTCSGFNHWGSVCESRSCTEPYERFGRPVLMNPYRQIPGPPLERSFMWVNATRIRR